MASDEPRYTREEWEEIQAREFEESARRARERGDYIAHLHMSGDFLRTRPREQVESLLKAKAQQLVESALKDIYGGRHN